jgi:hypothetical protein
MRRHISILYRLTSTHEDLQTQQTPVGVMEAACLSDKSESAARIMEMSVSSDAIIGTFGRR